MKFLKRPKGAITSLLIALLVLSCYWIVKSEIKATSLQSRLDEHHKQLEQNADYLKGLTGFLRSAGMNIFHFDKEVITISSGNTKMTMDPDGVEIGMGDFFLQMDKSLKTFELYASPDLGMNLSPVNNSLLLENNNSLINLKKNSIDIETKGSLKIKVSNDITFGYDKDNDRLYMDHKEAKILVGDMTLEDGKIVHGISLTGKSGEQIQVREDGILVGMPAQKGSYYLALARKKKYVELKKNNTYIRMENDDIKIEAKDNIEIKVADDKSFGYDKDKDRLYMNYKGSRIFIGNAGTVTGSYIQGITLISDYGTQLQILDKGIFLAVPGKDGDLNSAITLIKFENGNIDIEADGDINITSKNGKVNINGKR